MSFNYQEDWRHIIDEILSERTRAIEMNKSGSSRGTCTWFRRWYMSFDYSLYTCSFLSSFECSPVHMTFHIYHLPMVNKKAVLLVTSNQYLETPNYWGCYLDDHRIWTLKSLFPHRAMRSIMTNYRICPLSLNFIKKNTLSIKQTKCTEGRVKANIQIQKDPNDRNLDWCNLEERGNTASR